MVVDVDRMVAVVVFDETATGVLAPTKSVPLGVIIIFNTPTGKVWENVAMLVVLTTNCPHCNSSPLVSQQ